MSLKNVRIVLVNPSHPGNVGAAARAMKTMCLESLYLVAPRQFPSVEASARASGATDVLAQARVCANLEEALADCHVVIGTSARSRRIEWPQLEAAPAADRLLRQAGAGPVAVVFGRERMGLTNEELDRCDALVSFPANPDYASLNLAAAVQLMSYELRLAEQRLLDAGAGPAVAGPTPASREQMRLFYAHLEQVLIETGFLDPNNPRKLMRRLHRLFNRAAPDARELNILRGMLTSVQQLRRFLDRESLE